MCSIVLVVEDDPVSVHLLEIILQRNGYKVIAARNGLSALELTVETRPAVVIIDDMMPGLTGGETCLRIKSDPELANIPVILISAGMRVQDAAYIKRVGADYALVKPVLPKDVLRAVEMMIGK